MQRQMLKSKIHRATVTDCDVDYVGSITIDPELMRAADLIPHEQVHVWDVTNAARFVTYVIEGKPGKREMQVNGAAAHLTREGHTIIVASFGSMFRPFQNGVSRSTARWSTPISRPKALATASAVISSCVGPMPPLVKTKS